MTPLPPDAIFPVVALALAILTLVIGLTGHVAYHAGQEQGLGNARQAIAEARDEAFQNGLSVARTRNYQQGYRDGHQVGMARVRVGMWKTPGAGLDLRI